MFKKDSFLSGIVIGIVAPPLAFGVLFLINMLIAWLVGSFDGLPVVSLYLLSLVVNLLLLRYYFVKAKFDRTGRGILLITFIGFFLYFILFHNR